MNPAERLLAALIFIGSVLAIAKYAMATAKLRESRRRERLGAANAAREQREATGEICAICDLPVKPDDDIFDEDTKTWWHRACWRESVK